MKRVLFLADCNSAHTFKWVTHLAEAGMEIGVFSFNECPEGKYDKYPTVQIFNPFVVQQNVFSSTFFQKVVYLKALSYLKPVIQFFKPDIIHAHYATSYGLLGARCGFRPFFISVWGSDVMHFPEKSLLHKSVLKKNLREADLILATGHGLKAVTEKYTGKEIKVIPFGIDINKFKSTRTPFSNANVTITLGIVKTLEKVYGIEILLQAFKVLFESDAQKKYRLLLVGDGSKRNEYETYVAEHGLSEFVEFTGKVDEEKVIECHNRIDIFVTLSIHESFGVSLAEAMACSRPVVATKTIGFTEIIDSEENGLLVDVNSVTQVVHAVQSLVSDQSKAIQMGKNGRKRVAEKFDLKSNITEMISVYNSY